MAGCDEARNLSQFYLTRHISKCWFSWYIPIYQLPVQRQQLVSSMWIVYDWQYLLYVHFEHTQYCK